MKGKSKAAETGREKLPWLKGAFSEAVRSALLSRAAEASRWLRYSRYPE